MKRVLYVIRYSPEANAVAAVAITVSEECEDPQVLANKVLTDGLRVGYDVKWFTKPTLADAAIDDLLQRWPRDRWRHDERVDVEYTGPALPVHRYEGEDYPSRSTISRGWRSSHW